jgi:MFS family permease
MGWAHYKYARRSHIVCLDDVADARPKEDGSMPSTIASSAPIRPRYTLLLLTLLSALAFMDRQILAVLIEPIKQEFGISDLQVGLITGLGFSLPFALLGLPLGRMADHGKRRSILVWTRGLGGVLAACGGGAIGFWTLLMSRSGSAVSEAGGGPASMSMLSDLYPPEQRSRVISVLGMGGSLGALMALLLGAWLAQHYGWRTTMVVVGLSVLVLTLLLRFTVQEPLRQPLPSHQTPARGTLHELWHQPATRWLVVGAAFALLAGYGFGAWNNALLVRRHDLTLQQAGWISGAAALSSMLGALWSGHMTDRLTRRHAQWQLGVPMLGLAGALPTGIAYLMLPSGAVMAATVLMVIYAFLIVWWAAPVYVALSFLVPAQRRASAHAVMILVGSIIGSGLGPIMTGWLSDLIHRQLPGDGLRLALVVVVCMLMPSIYAFYRVMRLYPGARLHQQTLNPMPPQRTHDF